MNTYRVYYRNDGHVGVVKKGRTIWGLLFGWFWLVWNRLWLSSALVLIAVLMMTTSFSYSTWANVVVLGLVHLFVWSEGYSLIEARLYAQGYNMVDEVNAYSVRGAARIAIDQAPQYIGDV